MSPVSTVKLWQTKLELQNKIILNKYTVLFNNGQISILEPENNIQVTAHELLKLFMVLTGLTKYNLIRLSG